MEEAIALSFSLPKYNQPDFNMEPLKNSPDADLKQVSHPGTAPDNYHATTIFPEYVKIKGEWKLLQESRMDCVIVVEKDGALSVKEFRNLKIGDWVVAGRSEDGTEGIYVHTTGFEQASDSGAQPEAFAFRTGRSRETSFSRDYDRLYELLRYEKEHGYIVWVMGPAVSFDHDSRQAMVSLIEKGYADAILAGNALATHDLEAHLFRTALGQDIYHQTPVGKGHYHHIDTISKARRYASIKEFVEQENIQTGIVQACLKNSIPLVLAGSIRDDGPLPDVYSDVYQAQDAMRKHTRKATTLIGLATQLHTIAAGNMTPSYHVQDDTVRPVFIYTVDISEFVVNKLKDRGSLSVTSIVTNIQDFLVQVNRNV